MEVLKTLALLATPVFMLATFITFFVRTISESTAAKKIEKLGTSLIEKIDALKDTIASINTTLKLAEERHATLAGATEKLDSRLSQVEHAVFRAQL